MATISRLRVAWTGFPGAPGVSTFYSTDAAKMRTDVIALFSAILGPLPADVHLSVPSQGDIVDVDTGVIVGGWSDGAETLFQGASQEVYAAPVGAVILWSTSAFTGGRRLKGRTFIVPLASGAFFQDGSLGAAVSAILNDAAAAYAASGAGTHVIYRRPKHPTLSDPRTWLGSTGPIIGGTVPDMAAVLTSRRA